ncbi:MAG: hypothetical protein HOV80_30335, partial [Polyangiaceae bacterium]|nr:hypothetical protein [Polyangiaceae bacterium]
MSKVLAKGRIGVDAAKAMDKLRDHLLADPSSWLAEVVRVATLSHATHVDITYDTDDLFVRFDGDSWKNNVIEHAAAALGTSGAGGDRRGYLLAVASFAALGTGAKQVSVITRTEDGALESSVLSASGLGQKLRGDAVAAKDKQPIQSFCLHVEHGFTGIRIGRLVRASRPTEVDVLAARLEQGAPAITVNGAPLLPPHAPPLLSMPIAEEDGLVIEVIPSWSAPPQMVFCELGVVLSSAPWKPESPAGRAHAKVALPLRAVVRRDRLVTNVSRSRVEEELERRVSAAIDKALPALIEELKKHAAAEDRPQSAPFADALGAMGVVTAMALDTGHSGDDAIRALEPVLGLPLLWDAVGRRRSLQGARRIAASRKPVFVREAAEALPADHLPLTHDVFWLRGGTAEAYLRAVEHRPYKSIARDVTRGVALRNGRLAASPDALEVIALPDHVIVHREESGSLRALLALRAPGRIGAACTVRLHVDGRLCETISLPEPPSGIPFDAALEWPEVLHPNRTYDGVLRDEGLDRAIVRLGRLAREGVVAHIAGVPVHRSAEARALVAGGAAHEGGGALRGLAVWPVVGRPALTTIDVAKLVEEDGGVRSITAEEHDLGKPGSTPGPVLILDDADRRALRTLLGGDTRIVPYAAHLARSRTTPEGLDAALAAELGEGEAPWVRCEGEGRRFVAAPAEKDIIVMMHRGEVVSKIETPPGYGLAVAFDDEGLLPGVKTNPPKSFTLGQQVSRVLHGFVKRPDAEAWSRRSEAVRRLVRSEARKWAAPSKLHLALKELPLFSLIEDGELAGHCSASMIAGLWPTEVPRVETLPEPRVE